jgi:hypothetical protein
MQRRQAAFAARRFERLGLTAIAVGLVEQLAENRRELRRQREGLQFADHALDAQCLLALLFETGKSGLENIGWGLAEAALAFAMEIDGRRMQGQQQADASTAVATWPKYSLAKSAKRKLAVAQTLPEKLLLDAGGERLGLLEQERRCRFAVTQQNVGRLDLAALSGSRLDLQGAVVVDQNSGRPEGAVFFI